VVTTDSDNIIVGIHVYDVYFKSVVMLMALALACSVPKMGCQLSSVFYFIHWIRFC